MYNRPCALGCRVPLAKPLLTNCHIGVLVHSLCKCRQSTNNEANVLSFVAPVWMGFETDIWSPTDLLVNCAITRSTKLSISCHISNVDYTVCNGPPTFCNGDWLACENGMDFLVWFCERNGEGAASSGKAEKLNAENEGKEVWMD